jgi:hypothetical protein
MTKVTTSTAQLALDTILQKPTGGIPTFWLNIMQHSVIDRIAGREPGSYERDPEGTYNAMQRAIGVCLLDQYIPENPATMEDLGYDGREKKAAEGAERIEVDGMLIDSPEAVAGHLERVVFPELRRKIAGFDEDRRVAEIIAREREIQEKLGPDILKSGYEFIDFPTWPYSTYGYTNYFMAWVLYGDVIERHFSLQADLAVLNNRAAARAYAEGELPPLFRLDFDIADSRGTLASLKSIDRIWMPYFVRSLEPMTKTAVRMIWHCDGNLMAMVPRLLDAGIRGFQGFQYEDGMDYARICAMKTRDGDSLVIVGGCSVTRTLPFGTPADVRREMAWLVENGPKTGLFLGPSSSVAPGTPWENIQALIEGLRYFRTHGRS